MSNITNSCPSCNLKRSASSSLCPKCDKKAFLDKCKSGYDAINTMPSSKHFWFTVLFLFLNMVLPAIIIISVAPPTDLDLNFNITDTISDSPLSIASLIIGQLAVVIAFLLLYRKYLAGVFAKSMNIKAFLTALVIAVIAIGIGLGWDWIQSFFQIAANENQESIIIMAKNYPALSFVQVVIGAALAEEIAFRVGIFGFINRKSKVLAYIVSAVFFALVHVSITTGSPQELLSLPMYIIMGLFLAYTYEKHGLLASITVHTINNLVGWVQILMS